MMTVNRAIDSTVKSDSKQPPPQVKTVYRLWTVDSDGNNLRFLADNLPEMQTLAVSSHYGLVAIVGPLAGGELHTVEIVKPINSIPVITPMVPK